MKFRYLGTAAAEGFPGMFCVCEHCQRAKEAGGRNIRGRSQAIINDELLIDFPADTCMRVLNGNLNLPEIHHCLITHHHSDHLYTPDLEMRKQGMCKADDELFVMYASKPGSEQIRQTMVKYELDDVVELREVKPFDEFILADKYKITVLLAAHALELEGTDGCAVFYMIEDGDSKLLYANDTGYFPDATWEYLEKYKPQFTMVSLDCCGGKLDIRKTHMGLDCCQEVSARLKEIGCITSNTRVFINHFSHNCGTIHDELVPIAAEYGFEVAYDGCELEI